MPETASVGDMVQARVRGLIEGQTTENVLHFRCVTPDSDIDLHLILVLVQCFIMHLLPGTSDKFEYMDVAWKKVSPVLGNEFIHTFPTGSTGAVAGDSEPSFVSAVSSIRTALGGKSHRGRFYLGGIPEAGMVGSIISSDGPTWPAILAFVACLASKFIVGDPPGTNQWTIGVYSRKIGGSAFPYGASGFTPATQITPVQFAATTRSRKIGHGN